MQNSKITITVKDNKASFSTEGCLSYTDTVLAVFSMLKAISEKTIDAATKGAIAKAKDSGARVNKDFSKEVQRSAREDVADILNYAASNILNDICPKDPDLQLSEAAIAGAENAIIKYAASHKLTLKQALKKVDKALAEVLETLETSDANS